MLEQKKKIIGNETYLVTQMTGMRALEAQTKLIKILGPAVASVATGGSLKLESIKKTLFAELPNILSRFDDEFVNDFILSLFKVGVFKQDKQGNPEIVDFDMEFAGKINQMWKVALFILEVNFFGGKSVTSSLPITEPDKQETEN